MEITLKNECKICRRKDGEGGVHLTTYINHPNRKYREAECKNGQHKEKRYEK